ncbi:MAG: hypothetical protein MSH60_14280 [Ruminococcus sp.]|nr:hypothetical protein [Ruminococcus sp.]
MRKKIFSVIAALTAAVTLLTSCMQRNEPDISKDPLPSLTTTESETVRAEVTAIPMEETTTSETTEKETTTAETTTKETESSTETTTVTTEGTKAPETTPSTVVLTVTPPETETQPPETTSLPPETTSSSETAAPPTETTIEQTTTLSEEIITRVPEETTDAKQNQSKAQVNPITGKTIITRPYSYYKLTAEEQAVYDEIFDHAMDLDIEFTFSEPKDIDTIYKVYELLVNEEIELFYLDNKFYYSGTPATKMKLGYTDTKLNIKKKKQDVNTATQEILAKVTSGMSDYDIVKLFHDELIRTCVYDTEATNNIYGALVEKRTMCQGYAGAFLRLCNLTGIPALSITGSTNEPHMWNMVKIDGEWYHIDLTWDDPDKEDYPEFCRYDYFGLDTATIKKLRTIDNYSYTLPEATSDRYNYFVKSKLLADSYEGAKLMVTNELYNCIKEKGYGIQIKCATPELFLEVKSKMLTASDADGFDILEEVNAAAGGGVIETESIYYAADEGTLVIKIYLKYLS